MNSKWIRDLNIKYKTTKFLKDNIGENLGFPRFCTALTFFSYFYDCTNYYYFWLPELEKIWVIIMYENTEKKPKHSYNK